MFVCVCVWGGVGTHPVVLRTSPSSVCAQSSHMLGLGDYMVRARGQTKCMLAVCKESTLFILLSVWVPNFSF